jgi:putative DNA primase/helicase
MKRMIGYSLTGSTREQFFLILYGVGGNGKSTLIEILKMIMGDYSTTSSMDAFIEQKHGNSVSNDIARLRGARFVSAIENDAMKYLAEGKLKALTGQDMISARFLFHEFFEFVPQFKLWLACNHKPIIKGTDHAMWRRIRLMPFEMTFDPNVEPDLKDTLLSEVEGIFAQAVTEAVSWTKEGITTPPGVVEATGEYRSEMDVLGGFLDTLCDLSPHESEKMAVIYAAYEEWCGAEKEKPKSKRAFGMAMRERGFKQRKSGSSKYYCGLKLKITPKQHKLDDDVEGDKSTEHIKEGTDGTDSNHSPISSPLRARVRSIRKTPSSVPSVPINDNVPSQTDPDEYHANRLKMTKTEAELLRMIYKKNGRSGDAVLLSEIITMSGLPETFLQDIVRTSREAERLEKVQFDPEPGFVVTFQGRKAIMEFEIGVDH